MTSSSDRQIADAQPGNWVQRYLPSGFLPYAQLMRLDRPIGCWLLLLPCWWGLALAHVAAGTRLNWWYGFLFLAGAIVMRGAGCVVNDIMDRDIDAKVERTRNRPIPSGRVSVASAAAFLVALLLIGLVVLLQFNWFTIVLALCSMPIVAVYPLMKRVTSYPQVVLGLAFNWGALVGWTAISGSLSLAPLLLYVAAIFWTLAYDTIYAHQDKEDDAIVGVYSTALRFGEKTPILLIVCFGLFICLAGAAFWIVGGFWSLISLIPAILHAAWQIARFDGDESALCLKLFKSNRTFGLIILTGLLLDIVT
jgi:4-hydroxybenzoate polyprenyltransferase